jgi:hypothetical protein
MMMCIIAPSVLEAGLSNYDGIAVIYLQKRGSEAASF